MVFHEGARLADTCGRSRVVSERSTRLGEVTREEQTFYKDATPKAEHYVSFRVCLPGAARRGGGEEDAPLLELELVSQSSSEEAADDATRFERVAEQAHLKAVAPSAVNRAAR